MHEEAAARLLRVERLSFLDLGELPNPNYLAHVAVGDLKQARADEDPTMSGDRRLLCKQPDWFSLAEIFPLILAKLVKRIHSLEFINFAELLPDNIELMRRADSELTQGQRQLINRGEYSIWARGCNVNHIDIQSAYRIIPVHPGDRSLLGMRWQSTVCLDAALQFRLRLAPKTFRPSLTRAIMDNYLTDPFSARAG